MSPILNNANYFDAMNVLLFCIIPSLDNNKMELDNLLKQYFGTDIFAENFLKTWLL